MEIIQGKVEESKSAIIFAFKGQIRQVRRLIQSDSILFIGYPFLEGTEENRQIDALLISREIGIVIFDLHKYANAAQAMKNQDDLITLLSSKISRDTDLARRGILKFQILTATFCPGLPLGEVLDDDYNVVKDLRDWENLIDKGKPFESLETYKRVLSIIQAVQRVRPSKKRDRVVSLNSLGAKLKRIEKQIANLDTLQNKAVVETNPGPQLIRGLAGTGKTVVLAAKAAYLHNVYPDKTIGVSFYSRSLYPQFRSLINKFCLDLTGYEADFNRIQILHAWGARQSDGFFRRVCRDNALKFFDFNSAASFFGTRSGAFKGAVSHALQQLKQKNSIVSIFDILLIDEGQDLPVEFFQLAHACLSGEEKQLVIAFDESQRLNDYQEIPDLQTILGLNDYGEPVYTPSLDPSAPADDITLKVCYRNPKEILTLAHCLELGIYREQVINFPMAEAQWSLHGYEVEGDLVPKREVVISRKEEFSPEFFADILAKEDILEVKGFASREEQFKYVFESITRNINECELEHTDVLVIFPCQPYELAERSSLLHTLLTENKVKCHYAGAADPDIYFINQSVAISHIYRAKGNEAPIVYLVDADDLTGEYNLSYKRKVMFTAITRAKAFCRIFGTGEKFEKLESEIKYLVRNNFTFKMRVPSPSEILNSKGNIEEEKKKIISNIAKFTMADIFEFLESGLITNEDLPDNFKRRLSIISNGSFS